MAWYMKQNPYAGPGIHALTTKILTPVRIGPHLHIETLRRSVLGGIHTFTTHILTLVWTGRQSHT